MTRSSGVAVVLCALLGLPGCGGGGSGLSATVPDATYDVQRVFPTLAFNHVTALQSEPDAQGRDRLFVVEKGGLVEAFHPGAANPTAETFLDISQIAGFTTDGEGGLLGLVFDPRYADNRRFYVHYTIDPTGSGDYRVIVARFEDDGSRPVDTAARQVLLEVPHPGHSNHFAGAMAFDPVDGYLYLTMGDGGGGNDSELNGQDPATLLGSILRIDVTSTRPAGGPDYVIPQSNPFSASSGLRGEIFAYGFRNPWRLTVDQPTAGESRVWIADVGQNRWEEVDVIDPNSGADVGGNFGWNCKEGLDSQSVPDSAKSPACASAANLVDPVVVYGHDNGNTAITGGYVYRGSSLAGLVGRYIYGDYGSGRIWAYRRGDSSATELVDTALLISTFGTDAAGELYVADYASGGIYRLVSN